VSRKTNKLKARMVVLEADVKRRESSLERREHALTLREHLLARMQREAIAEQKKAALTISVSEDARFGEQYVLTIAMMPEMFGRQFHRQTMGDFGSVNFFAARVGEEAGQKVRRAIMDFMTAKVGGAR
jgi:hypothetical protein